MAAAKPMDLFPPGDDLIAPAAVAALPAGYVLRPLRRTDYDIGFLDALRVLTTVGEPTRDEFEARFDFMARLGGTYFVLVIEDTDGENNRIVGTGTLIVERKFIHSMGQVGHIEEIAILQDQQGKALGKTIILALGHIAKTVGCYKAILDCSEKNEGFYVKCGFKRAGLEMANYFDGSK